MQLVAQRVRDMRPDEVLALSEHVFCHFYRIVSQIVFFKILITGVTPNT